MPGDQTPREFAAAVINNVKNNINAAPTVQDSGAFAAMSTAQAHLAIAAALLDVADAIRGDGGTAQQAAMDRMTEAVREAAVGREA